MKSAVAESSGSPVNDTVGILAGRSFRNVLDALEETSPEGPSRLPEVLHEIAETVRQRALVVVLSDLFMDPEALAGSFGHLRFRRQGLHGRPCAPSVPSRAFYEYLR